MSYGPNENQNYYPPPPPPTPMNGKSIAGLVLGVLSIIVPYIGFLLGIVAVILSALSLKEIRIRYEQGRGLAIAGLVCGIVSTLLYAILILFFVIFIYAAASPPYWLQRSFFLSYEQNSVGSVVKLLTILRRSYEEPLAEHLCKMSHVLISNTFGDF